MKPFRGWMSWDRHPGDLTDDQMNRFHQTLGSFSLGTDGRCYGACYGCHGELRAPAQLEFHAARCFVATLLAGGAPNLERYLKSLEAGRGVGEGVGEK